MSGKRRHLSYQTKPLKQVREMLHKVDVVLEVLDARAPLSTRSRALTSSSRGHLLLLHKSDLAQNEETMAWKSFFQEQGFHVIPFHSTMSSSRLTSFLKDYSRNQKLSRFKRPLRLMVVGMPNVGKSTLVNLLLHKRVSLTGNKPGITRGNQWIRIHEQMEVLDTPGVLQPISVNQFSYNCLAALGVLPAKQFDEIEVASWLLDLFIQRGLLPGVIERYNIKIKEIYDSEILLEEIGRATGCLGVGGKVDSSCAAQIFLKDFREAALGSVTLDVPSMEGEF